MSTTQVATRQTAGAPAHSLKSFNQTITSPRMTEYLTQVLGERRASFTNNIVAMVANNQMLQRCEPMTVIYAAMKATALGLPLDPNLGQAYVIPYGNTRQGNVQAQFQIGYKGFIQLAIRSGQFRRLNVSEVREGELQDYDLLSGELKFKALPNRISLPVVGYVAHFELINGFAKSLYMTLEEVQAHRNRFSKASGKGSSPWDSDFDAMAKKTALKLLLNRYAPLSVEMQSAITSDQAVFSESADKPEYIDNPMSEEVAFEEISDEETPSLDEAGARITDCKTPEELETYYTSLPPSLQNDRELIALVQERKAQLETPAEGDEPKPLL